MFTNGCTNYLASVNAVYGRHYTKSARQLFCRWSSIQVFNLNSMLIDWVNRFALVDKRKGILRDYEFVGMMGVHGVTLVVFDYDRHLYCIHFPLILLFSLSLSRDGTPSAEGTIFMTMITISPFICIGDTLALHRLRFLQMHFRLLTTGPSQWTILNVRIINI